MDQTKLLNGFRRIGKKNYQNFKLHLHILYQKISSTPQLGYFYTLVWKIELAHLVLNLLHNKN